MGLQDADFNKYLIVSIQESMEKYYMPTAAETLIKTLVKSGVKYVFGIPSVHNLPVYEALQKEPAIKHILCRQETTACHIADGFARAEWKEAGERSSRSGDSFDRARNRLPDPGSPGGV